MSRTVSNVTPAGKMGMCVIPLIFVIVGVLIMRYGISNIQKAKASSSWPQANGKIISSELKSHHSSSGNGSTTWHAEVAYSYIVNGSKMDGNQIAFGDYGSSNPSHAQGIVGQYPVGKEVKVYYNPQDSSECLLEPGMHGQTYGTLGFGFAFFAIGSFFVIGVLKIPIVRKDQVGNLDNEENMR